MYRPFVFCHMMMTVDGKIEGGFFTDPAYPPAIPVFHNMFLTGDRRYECQAYIMGKTTAIQNFTDGNMPELDENAPLVPEGDFWPEPRRDDVIYCITVSNAGNINWKQNYLEYAGEKRPLIEIITSNASNAYKAYLRKLGIPYFICGDDKRIDPKIFLAKMLEIGVDCIGLTGGGMINWDWLKRGLIDELSVVICPIGEGNSVQPSLFSTGGVDVTDPVSFKFKNVDVYEGGVLHLLYDCPNSDWGYK